MSTKELRVAATTLRERAQAATPGPWEAVEDDHGSLKAPAIAVSIWSDFDQSYVTEDVRVSPSSAAKAKINADYIVTVDPALGLLLADVLANAICTMNCNHQDGKREAYCFRCEDSTDDHDCPPRAACGHTFSFNRLLAIARHINGTS